MLLYVALTAILSSVFTLGAAYLFYVRIARPRLRSAWEAQQDDLGDLIQERVRAGVLDALQSVAKGDPLVTATRSVTRTGASLVEGGLNALFGAPPRKRD